jgi:hypothetical protein
VAELLELAGGLALQWLPLLPPQQHWRIPMSKHPQRQHRATLPPGGLPGEFSRPRGDEVRRPARHPGRSRGEPGVPAASIVAP